jgi:hypothetical protein
MEGTLDQFLTLGEIMLQNNQGSRRMSPVRAWIYLGASGVLQPLSEEFLYRSPADPVRYACCRRSAPLGSQDHVAL